MSDKEPLEEPLDELYFKWLYSAVADPDEKNLSRSYWKLLAHLYSKRFLYLMERDENRISDARDLRRDFIISEAIPDVPQEWLEMDCSMLELMMVLAHRLEFEGGGEFYDWFWELIENLGLSKFTDRQRAWQPEVDDVLERVNQRTYNPSGVGGFFPLRGKSVDDQRYVELWYQLSQYLNAR